MPALHLKVEKDDLVALVEDLHDAEEAADRIEALAEFLDAVTPAGPLEMFDGPAYLAVLRLAVKRDPVKVAARKAKRKARKARRRG